MKGDLFNAKMLEILICPITQGTLRLDREKSELISDKAKLAFPIRNGVPIMLESEARPLDQAEIAKMKATKK